LNSSEGSNIWTVYCNDTSGNTNSSSVVFSRDTTSPPISVPKINATSDAVLNTRIKVNASVTDSGAGVGTVLIQIKPPTGSAYNVTAQNSASEYYNNTILLNEAGQWVFTFFANDSLGNMANSIAKDGDGNNFYQCC
jgi:hypothetical protein